MTDNAAMPDPVRIRSALESDAASLLEIYRPHVESSAVSFELELPSVEGFAQRIRRGVADHSWLIAEREDRCIGYAYGSRLRERPAYRWSVEVSAYVHPDHHRQGIGATLYSILLDDLMEKGFCQAFACIALPNPGSLAFHHRFGFRPVGVFKSVGRKFGRWHDVAWLQRTLRDEPPQD
jgi:phosphinothricin acetyltransferase